ncbi:MULTISPECIES: M23 family metallopeptidase [unclassified Rhodococcus (in: high G+C Gram-positive bacteria)]|uniref:M23 family metallopeptidase n=1 Tax=unclassified Rhodococcus (in: high G+C Gram-positive bacteria) TaxID=192944 RepID=UPI0027E18B01|nr:MULTISPECIES: M23 family metallopeptidase [unclassified Rhodococcus (in: high G+C Gram-positive bacteria)]
MVQLLSRSQAADRPSVTTPATVPVRTVSAQALAIVLVLAVAVLVFHLTRPTAEEPAVGAVAAPAADLRPSFLAEPERNLGPLRQIAKVNRATAEEEYAAAIAVLSTAASAEEKDRRLYELPPAVIGARIGSYASPARGTYTSGFGPRWGTMHNGIDIAGPIGTPILSVADGQVIEAGPASGFGLWVRVRHDDGTVSIYGHVDTLVAVAGQRVAAGQQIATMGNRGDSTGPHLHFETVVADKHVDPELWLIGRGISLGPEGD